MRIISGSHKGILINPPKGLPVRPTTDRAKESLFNILSLNFNLDECSVLDLFSGTGNIAYECCSRGAERVVAVDINFKCCEFIKEMKQKQRFAGLEVQKRDAYVFLKGCTETFDLIFADAPYAQKELIQIPELVLSQKLLKPGGWLIVEHESNLEMTGQSGFFDKRTYGQSAFTFFREPA